MSALQVTKRLGGYPCCHRQWRDDGHCSFLHGYDRWVELTWTGERDSRGWVVDFGGLQVIKDVFEHQFDHTTLVAPDDPALSALEELDVRKVVDLRVMDPTMEGMTLWVAERVTGWTQNLYGDAVELTEVACWENEKNAARWQR